MRKIAVSTLVIFILVAGGLKTREVLDGLGWIPHHEVTATYIGQNGWMPGEYRDCIAAPTREGRISPFRAIFGGFLSCDLEGHTKEDLGQVNPHELSVTYWGRIARHDMGDNDDHLRERIEWRWRCRRNEVSVTCWAVN